MRAFIPAAVLLVACGDPELNRIETTDIFEQAPTNQVDVLWVVDNSHSMLEEQGSVASGAQDFIAHVEETGMDMHLGVISTDVDSGDAGVLLGNPPVLKLDTPNYIESFQSRVQLGTGGSDQESGLEAVILALSSPLVDTVNAGFLRDDALLSIVVLSDENDCSDWGQLGPDATGNDCYDRPQDLASVADLVRMIQDLKPDPSDIVLSGIVGPDIVDGCDDTVPGRRYFTAIEMLGGVEEDICTTDYSNIMDRLGLLASGILTVFQLQNLAIEDSIEVMVEPPGETAYKVANDDNNGWTYNPEYGRIEFHGEGVPPRGALISVTYEVAGSVDEDAASDESVGIVAN